MRRVRLIHWNAEEAEERAKRLHAAGYSVAHDVPDAAGLREIASDPPAAFVIDLGRLPSQGRDFAVFLRGRKTTRHVPLVFVDGDIEKVARIRQLLPDAVYTGWADIQASLESAIVDPPAQPTVPRSDFEAYSGTPLPKKLGIKPNAVVVLIDAPEDFEETLGELPKGATLHRRSNGRGDLDIWFVASRKDLERRVVRMAAAIPDNGGLWIAWPKKTSAVDSDLTQAQVREVGLAAGLVDYKICAIDSRWSGLLFSRRKP